MSLSKMLSRNSQRFRNAINTNKWSRPLFHQQSLFTQSTTRAWKTGNVLAKSFVNESRFAQPFTRSFGNRADSPKKPTRELQECEYDFLPGVSFHEIHRLNAFFADNTKYLLKLSALKGKHYIFVRPTRFGKTLLLQTMEKYFDMATKESDFKKLFRDTDIARHVEAVGHNDDSLERGKWHVLHISLAFEPEDLKTRLRNDLISNLRSFAQKYDLSFEIDKSDALQSLMEAAKAVAKKENGKLMILIDEYDYAANKVLPKVSSAEDLEERLEPIISLYVQLKKIEDITKEGFRVFTTGITPFALGSYSGYNVAVPLTHRGGFVDMFGFTDDDVKRALDSIGHLTDAERDVIHEKMRKMFNGYRFSPFGTPLYNSTMATTFLESMATDPVAIKDVLSDRPLLKLAPKFEDSNVRMSQRAARVVLSKTAAGARAVFAAVDADEQRMALAMREPDNDPKDDVLEEFTFDQLFHPSDDAQAFRRSISFLLYQGVLTFAPTEVGIHVRVPNAAVRADGVKYLQGLLSVKDLFDALENVSASGLQKVFAKELKKESLKSEIKHEDNFEVVVAALMKGYQHPRWRVETQTHATKDKTQAYLDVLAYKLPRNAGEDIDGAIVLELKSVDDVEKMDESMEGALEQAAKYVETVENGEIKRLKKLGSKFTNIRAFAAVRCEETVKVKEVKTK